MFDFIVTPFYNQIMHVLSSWNWWDVVEICIIVAIVLIFYKKCIRHTRSEKLVRGILFLFFAWMFGELLCLLQLEILGMFIKALVALISLSLIVIFQPELRKFLGYLGQPGFISKTLFGIGQKTNQNNDDDINVVKELIEAVKYFTKTKTGALIVLQGDDDSLSYSEVGTTLNADVSAELLLTIFHPNTPLHDGAVIIKDKKILSAGVLLPLTENPKLSWRYGTRHRAAIGLTEVSDCACLVVSEETGDVSIAMDGMLRKYDDLATLKEDLEKILKVSQEEDEQKNGFWNFKSRLGK